MQCSHCEYPDSHVVYTKHDDVRNVIQRRRECLRCGARFTTHEQVRPPKQLQDDRFVKRTINR